MPTFEKTLTFIDGRMAADVSCLLNTWVKVWQYENTEPNSIIYVGGKHGYIHLQMVDASDNHIDGRFRLVVADPNEVVRKVVWEGRSELLDADTTDKTKKIKLDLRKPGFKYKSYLILEFREASATVTHDRDDTTNNVFYIDVTQVVA